MLTLGDADAVEQLRAALAVGCTAATHVEADPSRLGPADVAREIAAVVRDQAAAGDGPDLVLLGNDAADSGDFQVGIRLAYELGWPVVNGVATVSVEDGTVVASGSGPDGHETYRVPLPAVVTVLEGGVEPRYPTVPGRMKAKKVAIEHAHARHRAGRDRSGSGCCSRRRNPATYRSSARAPTRRPPWSTCSSGWGCWPDDPGAGGDRRVRGRSRSPGRRSRSRGTCPPRAAACPSTPSWSGEVPGGTEALVEQLGAYGVREVHHADRRRLRRVRAAPPGRARSSRSARRPGPWS